LNLYYGLRLQAQTRQNILAALDLVAPLLRHLSKGDADQLILCSARAHFSFDYFLHIAHRLLHFPSDLFPQSFDLLLFTANQFSGFFLHFAGDFFCGAFNLIFIHGFSPVKDLKMRL